VQPGSDEILTIEPYARPVDRRLIPQTPRHDLDHGDDILRVPLDGSQILGDGAGKPRCNRGVPAAGSGLGGSGGSGCLSADDLFELCIGENAPQSIVRLFTVHA
jgi:hypothetical protein